MSKKKKIIVIGLGTFGFQSAVALAEGGATVIAIDKQRDRVDSIAHYVAKALCGDATNEEVLDSVGAFDVDVAIVSLGGFFDSSVLVTHLLSRRRVDEILTQVDSQRQADAIRAVGATNAVFPERDIAHTIAHRYLVDPLPFERIAIGTDAAVIEVPISKSIEGKNLAELDLRGKFHVTVVAVKSPALEEGRADSISVAPDPLEPLKAGQILMVIGHHHHLEKFHEKFDDSYS